MPFHSAGMWMGGCPTRRRRGRLRSAGWGRRRRSGTLRGCRGGCAEFAPVVLLDGGGEGDVDAGEVVEETPAAGGLVDGEWGAFAVEDAFGVDGDVFGEEERVVLPLGFFVDPETPVVVGDEGAVFGVGDFGLCSGLGGGGI